MDPKGAKAIVPKPWKNQITKQQQGSPEEENDARSGKDIDEESTLKKFMNVERQGDLSPRNILKVKSVGKGKKRQQKKILVSLALECKQEGQSLNPMFRYECYHLEYQVLKTQESLRKAYYNGQTIIIQICEDDGTNATSEEIGIMGFKLFDLNSQKVIILILVYAKFDAIEGI